MTADKNVIFPWARVLILLSSLLILGIISRILTGSIFPSDQKSSLIFQNALLLIIFGSALLEYKFTKPADSAVNSLMGILTLIPVYGMPTKMLWWIVFAYCLFVFIISVACIAVSLSPETVGWRKRVSDISYQPAIILGSSRLLFSIIFLYAVFSFYGTRSNKTALLVLFWGIFIALWPLKIPELLSRLTHRKKLPTKIGHVIRTDAPNIVHTLLDSRAKWETGNIKILHQGDNKQRYVIPLYAQAKDNQILGTGLCVSDVKDYVDHLEPGCIYDIDAPVEVRQELFGAEDISRLIGFVDKDSNIGQIRFQTWKSTLCREGMLIWSFVGGQRVYYQVTEGITGEEGIESDKHGYQVALASQLGTISPERGFEKFPWLPVMNTPVFAVPEGFGDSSVNQEASDFLYGYVPGTQIKVVGPFADMLEYHTAILGITGSGKTELAFDLLRYAVAHETKVICIDLTAKYKDKLTDLEPFSLSISAEVSEELGQKLTAVETTPFGAPEQKKALKEFAGRIRDDVKRILGDFLNSSDDNKKIGIISLDEISNTKTTIFITEIYLTCLLNYARDNPSTCPRVLLVVEEAHTVMPESSTMGLGDNESKGLVAKIAQIALQGRKYRVGLLVIAQRTATVSKTVLTQCNTIVSFSCFDDTSLGFLSNFFGKTHTTIIPNLQFLQAVIFGKGLKSQRPIIVQIPYNAEKAGKAGRIME